MIAIDTNLLAYTLRAGAPEHPGAVAALNEARGDPMGWGVPFPVLAEFWRVVTEPTSSARIASGAEAAQFLEGLWRAGAHAWFPFSGLEQSLAKMARQLNVRGARIFDLQIALIARENGAREIWTHDSGFVTVPGLRLRDPLAR